LPTTALEIFSIVIKKEDIVYAGNPVVDRNFLPSLSPWDKPQDEIFHIARDKKFIAVSGSRKAGKTVVTTALGIALAKAGRQVVIIQVDTAGANLYQLLGCNTLSNTPHRAFLSHTMDVNQHLLNTLFPNLRLLSGEDVYLDFCTAENPHKILNMIRRLDAEYVILDLGCGSSCSQIDLFNAADFGIIVLTPDSISIQNGYQFMQLSVYRRLARVFGDDPALLDFFQQSFDMIANDQGSLLNPISEQIRELGPEYYEDWKRVLHSYQLRVIINQIQSEQDCLESLVLQVAAHHILNIDLNQIHYVHHDLFIRHFFGSMNAEIFMASQGQAAADLRKITDEILLEKGGMVTEINPYPVPDITSLKRSTICSVQCCYWGEKKCGFENNGLACPMTLVHNN
jgi:flagellar biosynthesis protein FlhG